ncbi:MAG: nucleotidyltransferase family protein [Proteobacteria bacterium]|nr:nucleotidyltransferase family protein [Pseudomonadota bacterium]
MIVTPQDLPQLQRDVRSATEALARALAARRGQRPPWDPVQWRTARAVAAIHGVTGLLAEWSWDAPPGWQEFLLGQRAAIAARAARIEAMLAAVHRAALVRGVGLIALKGAALHRRQLYRPGERPMADIDLWVAPAEADETAALIRGLGLRDGPVTWKHRSFEPPAGARVASFGESADNPLKVELHTRIREALPVAVVDITAHLAPHPLPPGVHDYPDTGALFLHLVLHAAGAMVGRSLRLVNLEDLARLLGRMSRTELDQALGAPPGKPAAWWAYPPLALTQRYFGCVPEDVLGPLRRGCPWALRRACERQELSDVSLSALWIRAFPGIEWSRSPRQALAYMAARLRPSPATLRLRGEFADSQPLVSGGEWARATQAERLWRWLRERQPRRESLQPLAASLAQPMEHPDWSVTGAGGGEA